MLLKDIKVMNNVKLDFFHLEESSITNPDIFSIPNYKPTLNNYSRFLVTFDDATTKARGIEGEALGYTFSVYKEVKDTNKLVYVAKIDEGGLSITDYNVVNDTTYKYYIFKEDDSSISEAVISNNINTCWWDWSLVDLTHSEEEDNLYYADSSNVWKFDLNVSSAATTQNLNNTTYNNLTKFPKVSFGNLNYSSGAITCILGKIQKVSSGNIEYFEPASMLEEWNNFCSNGHIKLLRDRKGNAMLVAITNTSSQIDDVTREQVNTITFNWVQVDNATNNSIIGA